MTAPELKPCPFCGGNASISKDHDPDGNGAFYAVKCRKCRVKSPEIYAVETCNIHFAQVRDAWNRRTDIAAVQPAHGVWNKCTFDLSGAGYDCVLKDGDARHGAYGEGQKVFWDGTTINADGLYILSKPALDKRIAAAQPAQVHPDPRDEVIARLVEAADECRQALKDYMKQYPHMVKGYLVDAEQHARAALAAAKTLTKETKE